MRNRERLLVAADAVFSEEGTGGSLEQVARRAGVGIGTLYRHFPTRDALVAALVAGEAERLIAAGHDLLADADADPLAALGGWLHRLVRHIAAYRGLASTLVGARGSDGSGPLDDVCHRQVQVAADLLAHAREAGAVRADLSVDEVLDLASAVGWVGEHDPTADTGRLVDVVVAGLAAGPVAAPAT